MNQQFNHQLEILQEGKNLSTNFMDNLANTITEFHFDSESGKKMDRHFPKRIFTERRTLENPYTNPKIGHPGTRPSYELHSTKVANGFHFYRKRPSKKEKRKLPPLTCWFCSDWHYARFCQFRKPFSWIEHKENFCNSDFKNMLKDQSTGNL